MESIENTREIENSKGKQNTSIPLPMLPSTIFEAEEMIIECHDLWRRSPGEAAWPFAGDGPWSQIQSEAGDYGGDGQDGVADDRPPRTPLRTAEVDRRDAVTGWLQLLPDTLDRKLVWLATRQLHKGESRIPWKAIAEWLKFERTTRALAWRYRKALALIVCEVNGWPARKARQLATIGQR